MIGTHYEREKGVDVDVYGVVLMYLYAFSFTCDACIFIFSKDEIRIKILKKKNRKPTEKWRVICVNEEH